MNSPDTIPQVLRRAASSFGSAAAIVEQGQALSFADLSHRVDAVATGLINSGLIPGDRVALWAPNCGDWIIAAVAAQLTGAAIVPLNTRLKGQEAGDILRRSGSKMLMTCRHFLDVDYPALIANEVLPDLAQTLVLDDPGGHWQDLKNTRPEPAALQQRLDGVTDDCLSDIIFTSGTTGAPKGVMCTHGQTVRAFSSWSDLVGLQRDDRYLVVNPFFHTFGYKAGWLACLLRGATILPMPVFDAGEIMARVAAEQVTVLPGPPTLFQSMLSHPDRAACDLSSLRVSVTGAANVPPLLIKQMRNDLGIARVMTGYGLTESTGVVTMTRPDDDAETVAHTCGGPIPDVTIRCVDDADNPVAVGNPGEVQVRGYNVMCGYLDDDDATAAALGSDGWLATGDIGVIDERGYLAITDRKKDMFIMGGFNCYPAEIEHLVGAHDDVAMVAVVGVPDERMGEVGKAFVVPAADAELSAEALTAWCRDHMANYKVPRHWVFCDALPMTASGKVQRFALRDASGQP